MPQGVPAPIPAILLLHGYGENRRVWEEFRKQLLERGWAVMSLDLRGHGNSLIKNQRPVQASPDWRANPREFPLDIDPALDWLKKQPRLNSNKIAIVGYDVGANLALISSGKFREVRTIVAVNPNLKESLELAGSAQDFHPHSALRCSRECGGWGPDQALRQGSLSFTDATGNRRHGRIVSKQSADGRRLSMAEGNVLGLASVAIRRLHCPSWPGGVDATPGKISRSLL